MDFAEFISTPLSQFGKPMYDRFTAFNLILNTKLDANKLIVHTLKGNWFIVFPQRHMVQLMSEEHRRLTVNFGEHIDINRFFEIRFWDHKGGVFLGCIVFPYQNLQQRIPKAIADRIKQMLDLYSEGSVMCSDCCKLMPIKKMGGSVWAGVYCDDCWEGKTGKYKDKGGWLNEKKKERVS